MGTKRVLITVFLAILLLVVSCTSALPRVTITGVLTGDRVYSSWGSEYTDMTILLPDNTIYSFTVRRNFNLPLKQNYTFILEKNGDCFDVLTITSEYYKQE